MSYCLNRWKYIAWYDVTPPEVLRVYPDVSFRIEFDIEVKLSYDPGDYRVRSDLYNGLMIMKVDHMRLVSSSGRRSLYYACRGHCLDGANRLSYGTTVVKVLQGKTIVFSGSKRVGDPFPVRFVSSEPSPWKCKVILRCPFELLMIREEYLQLRVVVEDPQPKHVALVNKESYHQRLFLRKHGMLNFEDDTYADELYERLLQYYNVDRPEVAEQKLKEKEAQKARKNETLRQNSPDKKVIYEDNQSPARLAEHDLESINAVKQNVDAKLETYKRKSAKQERDDGKVWKRAVLVHDFSKFELHEPKSGEEDAEKNMSKPNIDDQNVDRLEIVQNKVNEDQAESNKSVGLIGDKSIEYKTGEDEDLKQDNDDYAVLAQPGKEQNTGSIDGVQSDESVSATDGDYGKPAKPDNDVKVSPGSLDGVQSDENVSAIDGDYGEPVKPDDDGKVSPGSSSETYKAPISGAFTTLIIGTCSTILPIVINLLTNGAVIHCILEAPCMAGCFARNPWFKTLLKSVFTVITSVAVAKALKDTNLIDQVAKTAADAKSWMSAAGNVISAIFGILSVIGGLVATFFRRVLCRCCYKKEKPVQMPEVPERSYNNRQRRIDIKPAEHDNNSRRNLDGRERW
eukprot:956751_1